MAQSRLPETALPNAAQSLYRGSYLLEKCPARKTAKTQLSNPRRLGQLLYFAGLALDCRLLPNHNPEEALQSIKAAFDDESLKITPLLSFEPGISAQDNFLFRGIKHSLAERYPAATIVPRMAAGFTDSHFFREIGIPAYGFIPVILDAEQARGIHGDNEKISLANLNFGREFMQRLVEQVCIAESGR